MGIYQQSQLVQGTMLKEQHLVLWLRTYKKRSTRSVLVLPDAEYYNAVFGSQALKEYTSNPKANQ